MGLRHVKQLRPDVAGDEPGGGRSHPGRSAAREAPARPLVAPELWSQRRRSEEGRFEGRQTAPAPCLLRRRKNPRLLCDGLAAPQWCTRTARRMRTRRWARGRLAARARQPSLWGEAAERARRGGPGTHRHTHTPTPRPSGECFETQRETTTLTLMRFDYARETSSGFLRTPKSKDTTRHRFYVPYYYTERLKSIINKTLIYNPRRRAQEFLGRFQKGLPGRAPRPPRGVKLRIPATSHGTKFR